MKPKIKTYRLITENLSSHAAESYRVLRTNIQFASLDKPIKRILVTSAVPGEGKSTTTANLAIAFAQTGSRVLVIDADLRQPTMQSFFKVSNPFGLTNLLLENAAVDIAIRDVGILNLRLVTSGPIPPNPAEVLGSTRMRELIKELSQAFDYIMIDSPPVLAVADSAILSSIVDGVVLVVAAGEVSTDAAKKAKAQLEGVRANILGVVLNGLKSGLQEDHHYYYYYGNR